jgi:cytoskeletal protein RodZ
MYVEPKVIDSAPDAWCVESIRKAKGISLDEIATETKLKLATLQAIEAGDFHSLPGGIYNVSFIRQYARAIGVDEARLVQSYHARFSSVTQEEETCQPVLQLLQARPPQRAL